MSIYSTETIDRERAIENEQWQNTSYRLASNEFINEVERRTKSTIKV